MDEEGTSQKRLNRVDRLFDTLGEQQLTISHHVRFSLANNVTSILIHSFGFGIVGGYDSGSCQTFEHCGTFDSSRL